MVAEILSIGTELLLGDIVNTNTTFLSKELSILGIEVYHHTTVGDNPKRLLDAYKLAHSRADIIITSGGLGPTQDDLTKEIAAEHFNLPMIRNQEAYEKIKSFFVNNTYTLTENNFTQADFPEGSTILTNNNGTAPGCIVEKDGKVIIMLPGPPREMVAMFNESVLPYLSTSDNKTFTSRTLLIARVGESQTEDKITDLIDTQTNPTIATYAKTNHVELRVTASANTKAEALEIMKPTVDELYKRFKENIYGENEATLESVVASMLAEKGYTISCAESCTGGLVTSMLVNHAGISEVLNEAVVTYSNQSKIDRLNVNKETIEKYGVVSCEVAEEMAIGIAKTSNSSVGISTTGIAGPTGGTDKKPVGTVCMGFYIDGRVISIRKQFQGTRQRIRERAAYWAIDELRRNLL